MLEGGTNGPEVEDDHINEDNSPTVLYSTLKCKTDMSPNHLKDL